MVRLPSWKHGLNPRAKPPTGGARSRSSGNSRCSGDRRSIRLGAGAKSRCRFDSSRCPECLTRRTERSFAGCVRTTTMRRKRTLVGARGAEILLSNERKGPKIRETGQDGAGGTRGRSAAHYCFAPAAACRDARPGVTRGRLRRPRWRRSSTSSTRRRVISRQYSGDPRKRVRAM